MGGSILAEAYAVVGEYENTVSPHQGRKTQRRPHVIGEVEECRAERDQAAVQRHSIHNCRHCMLANAKVNVSAPIVTEAQIP
jgi:hypothetical protein